MRRRTLAVACVLLRDLRVAEIEPALREHAFEIRQRGADHVQGNRMLDREAHVDVVGRNTHTHFDRTEAFGLDANGRFPCGRDRGRGDLLRERGTPCGLVEHARRKDRGCRCRGCGRRRR